MSSNDSHPGPNPPSTVPAPSGVTGALPPRYEPTYPVPHPSGVPYVTTTALIQTSFTSKAVWTLVLYFIFYIPGLIANLVFWSEAHQVKQRLGGQTPAGYGCLSAMLLLQGAGVALLCMLLLVVSGSG